jgi:hypothetical protein
VHRLLVFDAQVNRIRFPLRYAMVFFIGPAVIGAKFLRVCHK